MKRWRLLSETRPPHVKVVLGFYVSRETITLLLLFWSVTWNRIDEEPTETFGEHVRRHYVRR